MSGPDPDNGVDPLIPRAALQGLQELLQDFRVVVVNGPRQAGKTTLLELFRDAHGGEYRTFDDARTLDAAQNDPETFARVGQRPLIIDEVQLGGDRLIRAIKRVTDQERRTGLFVLSGSTRFLTVPSLSESLAGRVAFLDLWPPSMTERTGVDCGFVRQILTEPDALVGSSSSWTRDDYIDLMHGGSYPEVIREPRKPRSLRTWFAGYLRTVISRDIQSFAHIRDTDALGRLLELTAIQAGGPGTLEELSRSIGVTGPTVRDYLAYLETVFLVSTVRPWSTNLTSRITKAPKRFITDTGLASYLVRESPESLRAPGNAALGGLTEAWVYTELLKLRAMTADGFSINHYRDRDSHEIDFVLEGPGRRVVGIEVKASSAPRRNAAQHLAWFRDKVGDSFAAGVVLYLGPDCRSLGDRLFLLPISTLWNHGEFAR